MAEESADQRRLAALVESWRGYDVLVLGDAMLDEWRFADSERLCREAPAPVLTLRRRQTSAGGAANAGVNLAALGARTALVAPVGADVAGDELHDCLDRAGVRDRTVTQPGWSTPVKRRLLAADQILVREDEGNDDRPLTDEGVRELLDALTSATEEMCGSGHRRPALVICDYGLGALPDGVRAWLFAHRALFATVALDAHDLTDWRGLAPTLVTPSFAEATRLLHGSPEPFARPTKTRGGTEGTLGGMVDTAGGTADTASGTGQKTDRAAKAHARIAELRERTGADVVAITLDVDGTVVAGVDGLRHRSHADPVPARQAVGAGDAYLAAMTLALAAGASVPAATQLAQLAATTTVSDIGTCVCGRDVLLAALDSVAVDSTGDDVPSGVLDPEALTALVRRHRRDGRSIVFTNGCFDVLHRGHVRYLEQARGLGDLLVVAVNSDESVRRLKGPDRPVNPVEDRVAVLAALSCVDHVVVFEEDSPANLIEAVRPDIYVKGGDYPPEMVPEAPLVRRLGGQVHTLGYVPDRSTSAIIDRIRSHAAERTSSPAEGEDKGPFLSGSPS